MQGLRLSPRERVAWWDTMSKPMKPDLLTIPGTEILIPSYGFLVGVGLALGWLSSLRRARRDRLPAEDLGTAYVLTVVFGTFGARALWLLQHPDKIDGAASFLQLTAGTFATGGGLVLGLTASLVFCARRGIPFYAWADCAAPAVLLALALERLGAFMAGTGFGNLIDPASPFAVRFPADSPVYAYQRAALEGLHLEESASLAVHPVQLYGAAALVLAVAGCALLRRKRVFSGEVACFALVAFSIIRMLLEDPFRADRSPEVFGPVRLGQVSAVALIAIAVGIYRHRRSRELASPGALRQWEGGRWTPAERGASGALRGGTSGGGRKKSKRKKKK
jgi:phosphatidylglycerol:prolipoprotein diacylglycerol transferase